MDYEHRLRLSKLSASTLLGINAIVSIAGGLFDARSAAYAIMLFSIFVLFQGLILCWHKRLFGTGRSVRLAMALTMAVCLTYILSYGIDTPRLMIFLAAAVTSVMSIRQGRETVAI